MIEVGDYIRTKNGDIGKVFNIEVAGQGTRYMGERLEETIYSIKNNDNTENYRYKHTAIVKHSKNIIDLIEEGDYVNGDEVVIVYGYDEDGNDYDELGIEEVDCDEGYHIPLRNINIKTIVTKEQFASMEYKVKEE